MFAVVVSLASRGAAALLCLAVSVHAAGDPLASRIDVIERAGANGEFADALRLSAELLAQTPDGARGRVAALQARSDALVDAGEWKAQAAGLKAAIATLPDVAERARLEISFAIVDATSRNDAAGALASARTGLAQVPLPPAFAAEMRSAAAKALLQAGKPDDAHAESDAARALWHEVTGVRARRCEAAMNMLLSQIEGQQGRSDAALEHATAAGAIAVSASGEASLAAIRARDQRASMLESLDRFPEARELREATLRISRERFGDRHLRTAQAEGALGAHLQLTGNYAPAREHYAAAESIMRSLTDAGARERLILANNYANLLQEMGDEDAALAHYRTAYELAADDRTRAIILTNIGNTEFRLGRYEQAIEDFQHALPLREKAEGKDSPGLSFALEGLGSSALALNRFGDAEGFFARAVALRGKGSAPNHSQLNVLNFGLALAHWGLGEDAEAFRLAVQTAERQQNLLGSLAMGFSEQQSVAYDRLLVPATGLAVTIAADHRRPDEIAAAWRLVMIERGLIARAETRRLAIARANADPRLAQLYRDWRNANSALGDGWMSSRTSAGRMAELQASADTAERELWIRLGYRQADPASAARPLDELAQALPRDGVLVAYAAGVGRNAARIVNAGAAQMAEDLYAFVLRPRAAPQLLRVGRIDALAAQTRGWYGLLRDPHSDLEQLRRRGDDLRRDLLGAAGSLDGARTLFVIPTGELFRISFAALPAPGGGGEYWIETGLRVHTLAHESELTIPAPSAGPGKVLLAGAPEFRTAVQPPGDRAATRQLCARIAEQGFAAIPGAARELDGLQGVLRKALGAGTQVDLLDGAQATKERVIAALDGASIVHLATHGFSFDGSCGGENARGIVLGRAEAGDGGATPALSGLAFAGADVGSGHAPLGILSAGELSASDLSHADWVALSACDSGLGPIGHSEGVFGMRRALRLAGARTVIMSLWEADDATTAELMQALYRARFAEHRNVPDAMAQAMRATLLSRRKAQQSTHPYYWAAFVSEGGWR